MKHVAALEASGAGVAFSGSSRGFAFLKRGAAILVAFVLAIAAVEAGAQQAPAAPVPGVDPALIDDLVAGSRILADLGVVDAFGHVSMRDPRNPTHFLMSRSLAPALVTADDIMEFDADANPVDARGRAVFLERFIHGEIYRTRPDVMAVVHTHSPGVIPFAASKVPLRAIYHNGAFLGAGVPIFDIAKDFGETDMLVRNREIGKALALALGKGSVVLMRGHGDVAVGPSVKVAVFRAYYTEVGARLEAQALALGGEVAFLSAEEAMKADQVNLQVLDRAWNLWKMRVAPGLAK
jgi:HCOMODA/2-hydroxy-3-carboxy-muconic semialdehyde decarboxylase